MKVFLFTYCFMATGGFSYQWIGEEIIDQNHSSAYMAAVNICFFLLSRYGFSGRSKNMVIQCCNIISILFPSAL